MSEKYRGHIIELVSAGEWVYSDTKESVRLTHESRTCGHCDQPRTGAGQDMCLGELRGIMNACCGHGEVNDAYVQFLDGFCVRGRDAAIVLGILKKWSNNGEIMTESVDFILITREERRALEYLENAGNDLLTSKFDEDFEPIGPTLREQLTQKGLAVEFDGWIGHTTVGLDLLQTLIKNDPQSPTPDKESNEKNLDL